MPQSKVIVYFPSLGAEMKGFHDLFINLACLINLEEYYFNFTSMHLPKTFYKKFQYVNSLKHSARILEGIIPVSLPYLIDPITLYCVAHNILQVLKLLPLKLQTSKALTESIKISSLDSNRMLLKFRKGLYIYFTKIPSVCSEDQKA
jgi:hypothetical protein